jgi:hypothetical protein
MVVAESVGFEHMHGVENKELMGIRLPHDPLETLKGLGRDTY